MDGIEKAVKTLPDREKHHNMRKYEDLLNGPCKIRFKWYLDNSDKFAYRDLTGAEKHRLFDKINIPTLFPDLDSKTELQEVWTTFIKLIKELSNAEWLHLAFLQKLCFKNLLTYINLRMLHHTYMHVPQFLSLYGNMCIYSTGT